jgi:putative NADH-flavin reductase
VNLILLGATGRTGQLVVEQALSRGHAVTAVTRASSAPHLSALHANGALQVAVGDPRTSDALTPIIVGHNAVISCLGQRSRQDAGLLRDSAAAVLAAMAASGIRRYLVVSQGLLFPSWNPVVILLRAILARHVADSMAMERLIEPSSTDWTIVRPPRLVDGGGPRGHRARVGALPDGAWTMRYADLAAFLLDAAQNDEHLKTVVGVASRYSGPRRPPHCGDQQTV